MAKHQGSPIMGWEEALYYKSLYEARKIIEKEKQKKFNLQEFCFKEQLEFISDGSRYKTLCKSRRAGGTTALAAWFIDKGLRTKNGDFAYVTLDRGTAERIIWPELQRISQAHSLNLKFNYQKLWVEFEGGSILYLASGKDRNEVNKMRGKPFRLVAIDEAQSFRDSLLTEMIDDVLEASLIDYGGTLVLCGTPNASCSGYFFRATTHQQYKHFFWTMRENPYITKKRGMSMDAIILDHLKTKGITEDDPTFQREWLGKWVRDDNALVYKFNSQKNSYDVLPAYSDLTYVIGVDLGYDDSDAVIVWAFSQKIPCIYQVEEFKKSGLTVSELATYLKSIIDKYQLKNIYKIVVDTGGLGKKIHEEFAARWNIQCFPAQKSEKLHYISLFNDDLKRQRIFVKKGSEYADELNLLQWDGDAIGKVEDSSFENHLCDAGLYAYRECLHFLHKPEVEIVKKTEAQVTQEWASTVLERTMERYERYNNSQSSKNWWEKI